MLLIHEVSSRVRSWHASPMLSRLLSRHAMQADWAREAHGKRSHREIILESRRREDAQLIHR